jgi:FkbM family methyltransferase
MPNDEKDKLCFRGLTLLLMLVKVVMRNLQNKKFEPEASFLQRIIRADDICLDIGGAYGRYAYPMSRFIPQGRIYSFEPGAYSFTILSAIKKIFNLSNVVPVKKALGDEQAEVFLISPKKPNGKIGYSLSYISKIPASEGICESIEMTTIDNFCKNNQVDRVDFIKCDTEGAEMMIFKGARETIEKYKPIVLCEVETGHLKRFSSSPAEVGDFFRGYGYKTYYLKDQKLVEVKNIENDSNYFFIFEKGGGYE